MSGQKNESLALEGWQCFCHFRDDVVHEAIDPGG